MDIGALLLAVIGLVTAILEGRARTAPARAEAERNEAVDGDIEAMDRAIADLDAASIGARFERERREALKRLPPQSGPDAGWLP